ncbi:UNVERIFIED_CONTAM: SLIT-ROBO Rho GTPase-activating protein 1 [Gekko kuhli]
MTTSRGRRNSHTRHQDSGKVIPLIVESCIRFINLYGLQHQGIFRVSGSQVEVNDIKNSFERGKLRRIPGLRTACKQKHLQVT